jgi:hypothetical protein
MRSGDYPIQNTRYVGIIIMLSGMKNIPRLDELAQLREEYRIELEQEGGRSEEELQGSPQKAENLPGEEVRTGEVPSPAVTAGEIKDRMITVPGSRKTQKGGRSAPLFEGLNMSIGKVRGTGETQGREGGAPTEITRKTVVKGIQAPKDTVFGLKDIRMDRAQGKASEGGPGVGVPRANRPKDEALTAGDIRFRPSDKAKDVQFTSRDLQVKGKGMRATDTSLLSPGRGKVPAAGKPRELDPGKRRIEMIDPSASEKQAGGPEKKPKGRGRKDDEGIGWIH